MGTNWKDVIGTVAPTIATALGGPLAGIAVGAIAKAIGLDEATEERVSAAIAGASSEDLLKLKQAELEFKTRMAEAGIDLERIAAEDRNSARRREMSVRDWTTPSLAWMVIMASVAVGVVIVGGYSPAVKDPQESVLVGTVIGYVFSEAKQVLAYYFGSSSGSRAKDETISKLSA